MIPKNIILNTDSYKASHFLQYPPDTTCLSSYIESRGGKFPSTLFFGLQMFIKEYLQKPITANDIQEAEALLTAHGLPFNRAGWEHIVNKHGGFLPLFIEAVAEGALIPVGNVLLQIHNTDPQCPWLTHYLETALLRGIWYPTTIATLSWYTKAILHRFLKETADSMDSLPFKLHDFGARGVSSFESAALGGLAHLVSFQGTDTISALLAAKQYYHEPMAGFSIPAAEHSTITSWGKAHEVLAFENMIRQFAKPNHFFAVVSDSYDLWLAIEQHWGNTLKQQILESGATLVIRPDSGDPVTIVTETIERLMHIFGFTTNSKGFRVLPACVRVIQGDGVSIETIETCLGAMKDQGQSAENITFGMGGALLQKVHRDTLRFVMKAAAIERAGLWHDIYKDPITDPSKRSKAGRLALIFDNVSSYRTIQAAHLGAKKNILQPVFKNGELLKDYTFADIRARALTSLPSDAS